MRPGRLGSRLAASMPGMPGGSAGPGLRSLLRRGTRRRTRSGGMALVVAAAAALVAGCMTLAAPSGPSQLGRLNQQGVDQGQAYPQLIPVPPGGDWSPESIVSGFLAASASF